MRVKLFAAPERECYDTVVAKLKKCCGDIDTYLSTPHHHELKAKLLGDITGIVPRGIYMRGCGASKDPIYVEGVHPKKGTRTRERAFYVRYAELKSLKRDIPKPDAFREMSLVDTEGFLTPVCRDGYRGPRFVLVGVPST